MSIQLVTPPEPFEQLGIAVHEAFGMRNGEAVMITSSRESLDEAETVVAAKRRQWMTSDITAQLWTELAPDGFLRQLYFHKASPTRREIWDMAFKSPATPSAG